MDNIMMNKTKELIESYNINFYEFKKVIIEVDALITGSFALAGFLQQEGIDIGYEPNDIDIFVSQLELYKLFSFIETCGYKKFEQNVDDYSSFDESDNYCCVHGIDHIVSFRDENDKKIQVIVVKSDNMKEYINKNFDLSVCISWLNANNDTFETLVPELTKKKEMYVNTPLTKKLLTRIEKYEQRGFTIVNRPHDTENDEEVEEVEEKQQAFKWQEHQELEEAKANELFEDEWRYTTTQQENNEDIPDLVSDSDTDVLSDNEEQENVILLPPVLRRERSSDYLTPDSLIEVDTPSAPRRVLGDMSNITIRPRRLPFN
jgi:hypothetical protein